jgi:outer membrane protein insertion porin family
VRLSSFVSTVAHDSRDDAVDPGNGHYLSETAQLAARSIGSEVGFGKTFTTAEIFRTVPHTNHIVFAGRAVLGLADVFPRTATVNGVTGVVEDLPASERFFAGGDTTVRGYALDTLGTPATKDPVDGFPLGGSALVIFNAEARVPVWKAVGVVGFVDAGNVWAHVTDIDLSQIRAAVGFGVRYKSPVGPLRIDLGFKLHPDLIAPGVREPLTALHISLGQAF